MALALGLGISQGHGDLATSGRVPPPPRTELCSVASAPMLGLAGNSLGEVSLRATTQRVAVTLRDAGRAVTQEPALTSQAVEHLPLLLILSRPTAGPSGQRACSMQPHPHHGSQRVSG